MLQRWGRTAARHHWRVIAGWVVLIAAVWTVRAGMGGGGRIVIAAALIMVFVFASYVFQPGAAIEQFGFGMAVAILLDAFVTRMTALPAVMHLGGDRMWWPGRRHHAQGLRPRAERPAPSRTAAAAPRRL